MRSVPSPVTRTSFGGVETRADLPHALGERLPVDEHGAVEEVLVGPEPHARVLRERGRRELATDPWLLAGEERLGVRPVAWRRSMRRSGEMSEPSRVFSGASMTMKQSAWSSSWASMSGSVPSCSSGASASQTDERANESLRQGIRLAARDCGDDLLHERPRGGGGADQHLPAGLHVDAPIHEQGRVALEPRIGHEPWTLTSVTCYAQT